jgi:cytochrome c553
MVDDLIAALQNLYARLPKPAPESVPEEALRPGLAVAFAKDIRELKITSTR